MRINYKELANPLILLPIIILILYISGIKKFITYSFIFFFFISFINNLILVFKKIVKKQHYLFVYSELFFALIFLIPLFLILKFKSPFLINFFILGIVDFSIQSFYNICPRKEGKEIIKLWKNKLIKSERRWFHPISMKKYIFKDFEVEMIDSDKINPTRNHIYFDHFLSFKLDKRIKLNQLAGNNNLVFCLYTNNHSNKKDTEFIASEKGILVDKKLLSMLTNINKKIAKNILTAFKTRYNIVRIIFKKNFVLKNDKLVYDLLSKIYNSFLKP